MRWNKRDLVAGAVIVLMLGILLGQRFGRFAAWLAPPAAAQTVPAADRQQAAESLTALGNSFATIAEQVTPAVVNINATRIQRGRDLVFQDLFGQRWRERSPDRSSESLGSGVIISADGTVVTNNHNIAAGRADEVQIEVILADGRSFAAQVVGADPESDIAVLKIDATNLPVAEWGDSNALRVGEWVVAIGNPFGFSNTVTAGIVSAKGRREVGFSGFEDFIQTDAAINPGNSGGAMVDINGRLVGINTAIFSQSGGYQGIGFAAPAHIVRPAVEEILEHGRVIRGWLGVQASPLTSRLATELSVKENAGLLITGMYRRQPAHLAGLQPYDIITAVDGQRVESVGQLRELVAAARPGAKLRLSLLRPTGPASAEVTLTERPVMPDGTAVDGI